MDSLGICDQASSYFDQNSPEAAQRTSQYIGTLAGELETCDWDQLHKNYAQAMEEHGATESELRARISKLLEVFMAWSQTTVVRDETRALKRFKTQMQHVQNSEESLEKKRQHYSDVVKAFESALALLNDRMKS